MVLKAYREQTFRANIKFEDETTKEVTFRMPRNVDYYSSIDGNTNLNSLYTFANMAKPFSTPVQVETADGSILNIESLHGLIELGVTVGTTDVATKWLAMRKEVEAEKDKLVKKSKSAGSSAREDMPETKE